MMKKMGLVFMMAVMVLVLAACGSASAGNSDYTLQLGTPGNEEIEKKGNKFATGETIGFTLDSKEAFGMFVMRIVVTNQDTEEVVEDTQMNVDSSWEWLYNTYQNVYLTKGKYTFSIYGEGGELLAQEEFKLK